MSNIPPIYLRREAKSPKQLKKDMDVAAYSDSAATIFMGRWPGYYQSKPKKGDKTVMLNCFRWDTVWLEDKVPTEAPATTVAV